MKVISVSSYEEIKEIATQFSLHADNAVFYRGTSNVLVPSIVKKDSFNSNAELAAKENFLLEKFRRYSHIKYEFKEKIALDWEIRIAAREHGLASSLMDWSNSMDIALDFAIHCFENKKIEFASLWILNSSILNTIIVSTKMDKKESFQELSSPSIIQFAKYNESTYLRRKFIQGGYFLFQPPQEVFIPLEKNPVFLERLVHIKIPKSVIPRIWKQLTSKINLDEDVCPSFTNSEKALDEKCKGLNDKYL